MTLDFLTDPWSWWIEPFLDSEANRNALLAVLLTAVCTSVVGTWVVLRGMSFLGDALAHGVLPGLAIAFVLGADPTLDGMVMMAPTARWSDWFLRYWEIADPAEAYEAAMAPLDPVTWLPEAGGRPMRLQFASEDQYVPLAVAAEIAAAAGSSADVTTYETGHPMNDDARADRAAWLTDLLGLAPAP